MADGGHFEKKLPGVGDLKKIYSDFFIAAISKFELCNRDFLNLSLLVLFGQDLQSGSKHWRMEITE